MPDSDHVVVVAVTVVVEGDLIIHLGLDGHGTLAGRFDRRQVGGSLIFVLLAGVLCHFLEWLFVLFVNLLLSLHLLHQLRIVKIQFILFRGRLGPTTVVKMRKV